MYYSQNWSRVLPSLKLSFEIIQPSLRRSQTTCIVAHVDPSITASIMPVTGCYYNIKFSDIGKIDLKNLLDNERPSSRGLNAWIVEQK